MKTSLRFIRHGGIYRSDVSLCQLADQVAEEPRSGRVRPQPKGRAGSFHRPTHRLRDEFRLAIPQRGASRNSARLRFTGTPILKPFRDRRQ